MTFTYDLTTSAGKVRMLIPDRVPDSHVFEDDEIAAFLEMEAGAVKGAAALALETIASDQALVLKVIRLMDLQTDGAKLSAELRARAKDLRSQVEAELPFEDTFDIAEIVVSDFGARERQINELLRGGA